MNADLITELIASEGKCTSFSDFIYIGICSMLMWLPLLPQFSLRSSAFLPPLLNMSMSIIWMTVKACVTSLTSLC